MQHQFPQWKRQKGYRHLRCLPPDNHQGDGKVLAIQKVLSLVKVLKKRQRQAVYVLFYFLQKRVQK